MARDRVFGMTRGVMEHRKNAAIAYLKRHADRAVPAIELAGYLQIPGQHETRRRAVRKIVAALRDEGHQVCAGYDEKQGCEGYWLARSSGDWFEYCESQRRGARYVFARVRDCQEAVTDRLNEQRTLFPADRPGQWE